MRQYYTFVIDKFTTPSSESYGLGFPPATFPVIRHLSFVGSYHDLHTDVAGIRHVPRALVRSAKPHQGSDQKKCSTKPRQSPTACCNSFPNTTNQLSSPGRYYGDKPVLDWLQPQSNPPPEAGSIQSWSGHQTHKSTYPHLRNFEKERFSGRWCMTTRV